MAASADFDPRTAQYSLNLETRPDGILVPGGDWLLTAAFARSGPDLVIHGLDSKSAIVANYFATEEPAPLTTDSGARLNGAVVELLAGPRAPLQYADVQSAQASDATGAIGEVIDVQGVVQVTRADGSQAQLGQGDAVFLRDVVQAAPDGTISIRFVDGTTFALSDGARMTLDDLVYNPGGGDNVFSASVLQGSFIFLTGQIAPSGSMDVTTPVGTIGVRGTKVVCKLAVEGQESTITLLVDPSGHVGIVDVTNAGGTRVLDQANEATRVISFFIQPSEPVILSQPELLQLFDDVINLINQQNRGESDGSSDAASNEEPGEETDADTALTPEEAAEIAALDTAAGPELVPIDLYTPPQIGGPSQDFLDQAQFVITNYTFQFTSSQTGQTQFALDALPSSDIDQTEDPAPTPEPPPSLFTVISGGSGNDSLGSGGGSGRFQISGNVGDDALTGGDLGDILDGGDGDDVLDPGSGDDVVQGGAGNDLIIGGSGEGNDSLDGGANVDTVKYQSATQDINVNLTTGTASGDPVIGTDSLANLENVIGGGGNDTITGNGSANVLDGGLGNDAISSLAGDDTLVGGAGNDFLDGGDDVDVAAFSGKLSDYTVTAVGSQLIVTDLRPDGDGTDTLQNIEGIRFADQQVDATIFKVPTAVDDTNQLNEGQQSATNGAAMKTTVTVASGAVLTLRFNFLDSEPLLDEAFFKDFAVVVIDGQIIPLADVDDATSPVGAATLGFDDQTGYLTFTFTFAAAGTYELGLAVLNEGDTFFDAGLLVDAVSISGGAFSDGFESGLDGWTILGNVGAQGDFEGITPPEGAQQAVLVSNGAQPSAIEPFLGLAPGALANAANQPAVTGNVLSNDDFGPDGPGGVVDIVYAGNPEDVESTTGGGVTTITAADGSWRLEFDLVTGQYSFTVLAPIEHPGTGLDTLTFAFTYTMEDASGDSSEATLTIDVVDGVPVAVDDLQQVATEGGGDIAGNVFANDQPGLDGAVLTHVLLTGSAAPIAVPGSGPLVVTTDLGGTLTIFANGAWSYTPPADLPGSGTASDGFIYTVTDGDGDQSSATQDILVQQGGTDEPPSTPVDGDVAANAVAEHAANGVEVGVTALSLDPDGDPVTYSLTDSAGGRFAINATTGVVTVATGSLLDFEAASSHQIKVQATSGGLSSEQTFTIDVTNVNEPPSFPTDNDAAPNEVAENAAAGTVVGVTALSVDPDGDPVTYSLISDGGGRFEIDVDGVVTVADGAQFDFESATKSHQITVKATSSGGLFTTDSFVIAVTDVNEAPTITSDGGGPTASVLVAENQAAVTTVVAADPDAGDEVSYSIAGGFDGNLFEIDQATGQLKFVSQQDFENPDLNGGSFDHFYDVLVRATDKSGKIDEQLITVTLTDVNEAPGTPVDANFAPNTVAENATNGTTVGITALSFDPDSGHSVLYSLTDDADGRFAIDSGTGIVTVADGGLLDFENAESHEIKVKVTSNGGLSSVEQAFIIEVANVNEPPSAPADTNGASNQVAENAAAGTAVGITAFSLDPDAGDTVSYALSDDAGGLFAVGATTGVVTVANGAVLTDGVYQIKVEASSSGGLSASQTFSITVTDADDAPVLSKNTLIVARGGVDLVQPSELETSDADTLPSAIVYTLVTLPAIGALLLDGAPVGATFTQQDINDGRLQYVQDGAAGPADSFLVNISDGANTLLGQTINITVVQAGHVADGDTGNPNADDPLIVGDAAYGRLDIVGTGVGDDVAAALGVTAGNTATGDGLIRVDGAGATLTAGGYGLEIGDAGVGSLQVSDGATVTATRLVIGNQVGSVGFASVGGIGSLVAATGPGNGIVVGGGGSGTLLVDSGGRVTGLQLVIGDKAASDGVVTVADGGSEIVISNDDGLFAAPDAGNAGEVLVGNYGDGGLFVLGGGYLEVRSGVSPNNDTTRPILAIGVEAGSKGEVLVSGEGSTIALSMSAPADPGDLSDLLRGPGIAIGLQGTGTMTVQDKATVMLAGEEAFISVGVGNHLDPDDPTAYPAATLTLTTDAKIVLTDTAGGDGGLIVGDFKGGTGTVNVGEGAMISIVSDGGATVGLEGKGTLNVQNGGKVEIESDGFNNLVIGETVGSYGKVIVNGAGSLIATSGTDNTIQVGFRGEGKLQVTEGGLVSTLQFEVGRYGIGTVAISGAGSKVVASNDGGLFSAPYADYAGFVVVGYKSGSSGTVTITDGGQLEIRPGETANPDTHEASISIARDAGSAGVVLVSGPGSALIVDGPGSTIQVGRGGDGTLNVTDGGSVSANFLQFGRDAGAIGTGLVSGTGSTVSIVDQGSLNVGRNGDGVLTIQSGGVVNGTFIHIGREATGDGEVIVTGAGSKLISAGTNDSSFNVGRYGSGDLTVSNGGLVEAQNFNIGRYAGSVGVVEVSGAGSLIQTFGTDNTVQVGRYGNGKLEVTGGGVVSTLELDIGRYGTGTVNITGPGSKVIASNDGGVFSGDFGWEAGFVSLGAGAFDDSMLEGGDGFLNVTGGGTLEIRHGTANPNALEPGMVVARAFGSTGVVTVDGVNSSIQINQTALADPDNDRFGPFLQIGRAGQATMTISGEALVSLTGDQSFVQVGRGNADEFNNPGDAPVLPQSVLEIKTGGDLTIDGGSTRFAGMNIGQEANGDGLVKVGGAGSTITINGAVADFHVGDEGKGELLITGGGAVTVAGGNTASDFGFLGIGLATGSTGSVTVNASTLSVTGTDAQISVGGSGEDTVLDDGGTGTLLVIGGAVVKTLHLQIARDGTGVTTISNGGTVVASNEFGSFTDDEGLTLLDDGGFVRVGRNAGSDGTLNVISGGVLSIAGTSTADDMGLQIARNVGSVGTVLVDGSTISIVQDPGVNPDDENEGGPHLSVGIGGQADMTITGGAMVTLSGQDAFVQVGRGNSDGGFDDPGGSPETLPQSLLQIESGGDLVVDGLTGFAGMNIGQEANGNGKVIVTGLGSSIDIAGASADLTVGAAGFGELLIDNSATVTLVGATDVGMSIGGVTVGSNGQLRVSGPGSRLHIQQNAVPLEDVGAFAGAVIVLSGGQALMRVESQGEVTIDSPGANLTVGGATGTTGQLDVLSGGTLVLDGKGFEAGMFVGGWEAGSTGSVLISGSGSSITILGGAGYQGIAHVGYDTEGTITITDGGLLHVEDGSGNGDAVHAWQFGRIDGGGGTIVANNVGIEGVLAATTNAVAQMNIQGDLWFNGGTLEVDASANGQSDKYVISGRVDIWSAQFEFSFLAGYLPQNSNSFVFMQASLINVDFSNVQFVLNGISAGDAFNFNITTDGNFLYFSSLANTTASDGLIYRGSSSDDVFTATTGHDEIFGGDGNDDLFADAGDDLIVGGAGEDALDGGSGADTFYFVDPTHGTFVTGNVTASSVGATGDQISNFDATTVGSADTFQFSLANFNSITAADDDGWNFSVIGAEYDGTNATTALIYDSAGHLIYDDNGTDDGYTVLATVSPSSPPISADNLQTAA